MALHGKRKHYSSNLKICPLLLANSLFMVFAGAIALIILLGTLSYRMASRAVMQKYEDAVISAASSMSTSLQLICESVSNKAVEFYMSEDFNAYYNDAAQAGGAEGARLANGLNDRLIAIKTIMLQIK